MSNPAWLFQVASVLENLECLAYTQLLSTPKLFSLFIRKVTWVIHYEKDLTMAMPAVFLSSTSSLSIEVSFCSQVLVFAICYSSSSTLSATVWNALVHMLRWKQKQANFPPEIAVNHSEMKLGFRSAGDPSGSAKEVYTVLQMLLWEQLLGESVSRCDCCQNVFTFFRLQYTVKDFFCLVILFVLSIILPSSLCAKSSNSLVKTPLNRHRLMTHDYKPV